MTWPIALQHIAIVFTICAIAVPLVRNRTKRTLYFSCFALSVFIYCVGYLFEITSATAGAALVALRVQYLGAPYIGVFHYLFCLEHSDMPLKKPLQVSLLLTPPFISTLLVAVWNPGRQYYFKALDFVTDGVVNHFSPTPAPLHYFIITYNIIFSLVGLATVLYYFRNKGGRNNRRNIIYFTSGSLIILISFILSVSHVFGGWNPIPFGLACALFILAIYLFRIRQREWLGLGRDSVVENMADAFILMDNHGVFQDANPSAYKYFPALSKLSPGDDLNLVPEIPESLRTCKPGVYRFTMEQPDGSICYLRGTVTLLDVDGYTAGASVIIYNDTSNRQLVQELHKLATHDTLTGLLNRGTFFRYATRDFSLHKRNKCPASLLMIDIDDFKQVNDTYGHMAGDEVLTLVSGTLCTRLRATDIAGRYGGEELAVWLPGATTDGAAMIANIIRRAVQQLVFESGGETFSITISIGVAGLNAARHTYFGDLVQDADIALYRAKDEGKNKAIIFCEEMDNIN